MADANILPSSSELKFFFWEGLPKLTVGLAESASDTTVRWSVAPRDQAGAIITGGFLIAVQNKRGRTERIWVPAGAVAADGLSATGCVRGIDPMGLDYTVGDTSFLEELDGGSYVNCVIAAQSGELLRAALQGLIATGAAGFTIGVNSVGTVTVYRATGAATKQGFVRWNSGNTKTEYSNDGTTWNTFDNVTASNLVVVTNNDTTPGNLQSKTGSGTGITRVVTNPGGNEILTFSVSGTLAGIVSDVTATATEINQALDGISANVTFTNLNTLTGGGNADALHSHTAPSMTFFAHEAVTALKPAALKPIEVQFYSQLTDANLALGDSNVRRRHAWKFIPAVTSSSLTTMLMRIAEAVNGATTLGDLTISIQTDNAGAPSGTPVANGTANVITQATQRTWNTTQANRTVTWASPPTLTAGTTYWLVIECAATDATNFLNISVNSSHDESYLTFTRLTYNLDTASWGTSTTNATPFFWFNNQPVLLGMGLCPTDASWGGRTWDFQVFPKANIAAGATGLCYFDIVEGLSGLTPGAPYYLSETAGEITATAPASVYSAGTPPTAFTYRIGRALSSTVLKIEKGPKRVLIQETTNLTATTVRQYVLWFQPEFIRVNGVSWEAADASMSVGFVTAAEGDAAIDVAVNNAAAKTGGVSTSASMLSTVDSGNTMLGAAANFTAAGFQYTFTEAGTVNAYAMLEALQ